MQDPYELLESFDEEVSDDFTESVEIQMERYLDQREYLCGLIERAKPAPHYYDS